MIDTYLEELRAELTVPPRRRRRIVDEAADHLRTAVAAGASEEDAIERFGSASEVARSHIDRLAVTFARRGAVAAALAVAAYTVPAAADNYPGLAVLAVQFAVTCVALAVVRALRHRRATALTAGQLRFLNRSSGVAVAAAGAGVLGEFVAGRIDVVIAGAAVVCALAGIEVARAGARLRDLAEKEDAPAPAGEDAFTDISAVFSRGAREEPLVRRPWRFATAVAACAGFIFIAAHRVAEGPVDALGSTMGASLAIGAIEAALVLVSFAVLGPYLGIVRRRA